jgi:O-antigen/teichoic acid export membrane protein
MSIAIAMAVMNVTTYGFTMLAARILGPRPYGALASLMATLLVISVLQLGLQATAARRISADPGNVRHIESVILTMTYRCALGLGLILMLMSPVINVVLRLDSLATAAMVAIAAVPLTIMGGQAGVLQGEQRWTPLALMYIAAGAPRLVIGVGLILWSPTEASAMAGVVIGAFAPVIVGFLSLRGRQHRHSAFSKDGAGPVIRETIGNSQALLAFFALSNVDVIVARNILDDHEAGLYAGGLILTKAVLFLPQFVVVVAFPAMSNASARRHALTRSLVLVSILGAVCTAGAWLLPGLALKFIGGQAYTDLTGRLWLFAILGTVLSMLQLLVYAVVARQGQRSVYLVWAALAVVGGGGYLLSSLAGLLTLVLIVDTCVLGLLMFISLYLVAEPATETALPARRADRAA